MGREVRVQGRGERYPRQSQSLALALLMKAFPHHIPGNTGETLKCQDTRKGGCFEASVDRFVFSGSLSLPFSLPRNLTQTDPVFHPVHGHHPESQSLSNGGRLVPQQFSTPALTLGTVWPAKFCSCLCPAMCWLGNRTPHSSATSIWHYRKGKGIWELLTSRD